MELGRIFREERERLGYSLDMVEEETKIRKLYIRAIEEEDFAVLPPRVYATGFVKRYARLLKLDENELGQEFQLLAYGEPEEEPLAPVINNDRVKKKTSFNLQDIKMGRLLAAILFLVIVIWLGNLLVNYITDRQVDVPGPQPPSKVEKQTDKPKPVESKSKNVVDKAMLSITATQRCWVSVAIDGEEQYNGILIPSQEMKFEGKNTLLIKAGNAGGLEVTFNNKKMKPLGNYGEVVTYEFLKDGTSREIR